MLQGYTNNRLRGLQTRKLKNNKLIDSDFEEIDLRMQRIGLYPHRIRVSRV